MPHESPRQLPVTIGEIVADKYRVERVLGTGAMGVVVAARHVTLDQVVAIKLLVEYRFGTREESIHRFLAEARAAAKIASDHVCRVFDVGTLEAGVPYMVMEYLEGNDLEEEIQSRGQLGITEAADYVLQAADAIAAAHQLGIIHRDLKPANLFLALRPDGSRRVKVLDFGISHGASRVSLHEAGSLGTPAFMSPEQIRDPRSVDARSDIWSLGAILYEAVTGQMAFVGRDIQAVLDMVLNDDPCPMTALRRNVPSELEMIVLRCLERDRAARFSTAAAFAVALAPFGTHGSITQLASIQREVGSLASIRPSLAPSVAPMVASIAVREAVTQPDAAELLAREAMVQDWSKGRARKRTITTVAIALAGSVSLVALGGAAAWIVAERRAAHPAPATASAPPPEASTVADPVLSSARAAPVAAPSPSASASAAPVHSAASSVHSARTATPARSARPLPSARPH